MRLKNKDIAKMLGISATAVSLAINGRPGVSDETRRKVLELINESSQQALGEATSKGSDKSIVFVVHKATGDVINNNSFFTNLIETVQQEARRLGFSLTMVHYVPGQSFPEHLDYLSTLKADGMVLEATELDEESLQAYLAMELPCVLLDGYFDLVNVDAVTLDDQTSIFRAYDYAVKMGHGNIGFLAGIPQINNFVHHRDGFRKGVDKYSHGYENNPVIELPCQMDEAYLAMKAFLADPPRGFEMPTCFLSDLDNIALGAMRALKEAGYAVPDDVSIIGYGNTTVARFSQPALTTTQINMYDSGRLAVKRLAERLEHPERSASVTMFVSSELVIRDSVRKL